MEFNAANADELVTAIGSANAGPAEAYVIYLTGSDADYIVRRSNDDMFGPTAFPIITGNVTIEGNGRIIARAVDAPLFRLFGINAKSGHPNAKLTLKRVSLVNGDSDGMGGGAIVNDGELVLIDCVFTNNQA